MEKLNLHSPDFTQANIEKLAELFPNCVTETRAADGTLKKAIDFDLLKQELSTAIVEGPQERYQCWRRLKTDHLERFVPIEY